MSRNRIFLVTAGIMLSLFLASMESTVVATAMPTIVGQLGGLEHYSWVFSAFMLASTTAVPLYGKLSDLYGRRKLYASAMALFLIGSVLCGLANSMTTLIFARALQGIGAAICRVLAARGATDVARLAAWLASPDASWVTGQVIHSEGGFSRG